MRLPLEATVVILLLSAGVAGGHADCGPHGESCLIGTVGDLDLDGDVDLDDFNWLTDCLLGPGRMASDPECAASDIDLDGDADLHDFAAWQLVHTGACDCPPNTDPPVTLFDVNTFLGEAPLTVNFDAGRTWDAEAVITEYAWDFGDGAAAYGVTAAHTFTEPGEYPVVLTVTDAGGLSSSLELVVTVSDGTYSLDDPVSANEARRFLWQASFGPDPNAVEYLTLYGYAAWIDAQAALPVTRLLWEYQEQHEALGYGGTHPSHIWDDICVYAEDQLRQRVAWALIQIVVNNYQQNQFGDIGAGYYYSAYMEHALGNYRDLLEYVTFSHQMGVYLTYIENRKADPNLGTTPDENYARELMQLYTIGLWELSADGTRILDVDGQPIPTYTNDEVQQFARIFTGLYWNYDVSWEVRYRYPMLMEWWHHEFGAKQLLDYPGAVPPGGYIPPVDAPDQDEATALQDIQDAIDNVFLHPNCAPFLARQLIQRLVTSNPTPAYVGRVATAFEGGGPYGSGVRGDLLATVKAILLDDEARDPAYRTNPLYGMLKEPLVVRWALYRLLERVDRPTETFPFRIAASPWSTLGDFGQAFMQSPSVFNFYPPDYVPPGTDLARLNKFSPELKIYHDVTAMAILDRLRGDLITPDGEYESGRYDEWRALAGDPAALVAELNDELAHGTLSPEAQQIITDALGQITGETQRVRSGVWLVVSAPEFRVLK